ncbi:hypothetical protein D3C80_1627850 [compost metagenome]
MRQQYQGREQCAAGEHDEHRDAVEVAGQQAAEHRAHRTAAIDETGCCGTGLGRAEVDGRRAADHRVWPVQGQAHEEQQANYHDDAAAVHGCHERRQGHGQQHQADDTGRHAPGAEQLVGCQADDDGAQQPGQFKGRGDDRSTYLADGGHLLEDDHRPP